MFAAQDREDPNAKLLTARDDDDDDDSSGEEEADTRHTRSGASKEDSSSPSDPGPRKSRGMKGFGPNGAPIKAKSDTELGRRMFNQRRRRTHGSNTTHMPDFNAMLDPLQPQDVDVYDRRTLGIDTDPFGEAFDVIKGRGDTDPHDDEGSIELDRFFDGKVVEHARMTADMRRMFKQLDVALPKRHTYSRGGPSSNILTEGDENDDDGWIDIDIDDEEDSNEE